MKKIDECEAIDFGPYRLIPSKRILLTGKDRVDLGSRALDILTFLCRRPGELVTRRQLLEHAWPGQIIDEANLRVQMSEIRRVLGPSVSGFIKTVHGRGYTFVFPQERFKEPSASTVSTSASPKEKLPTTIQPTIGREDAVDALSSKTLARRFVTIVGPGGMGKTTLAIELGRHLATEFGGEVHYVDLTDLRRGAVLPAVATALGCVGCADDTLALAALAAHRRVLLIVDGCEHLIDDAAEVLEGLFQHARQVHIIATSREALRADGEAVYLLEPLSLPAEKQNLTASEALSAASVGLFMQQAVASGYTRELNNDQATAVAEICRCLDGNPLAIGLAGRRLAICGLKCLLEELHGCGVLRWSGRRYGPRHRTLEATLDWSFRLLSDLEQRVLERLSVIVGPFTMEAAQSQASDPVDDIWTIAEAVEELTDKSLISVVPLDECYLYRIPEITRIYVKKKLARNRTCTEAVMDSRLQQQKSLLARKTAGQPGTHVSYMCS